MSNDGRARATLKRVGRAINVYCPNGHLRMVIPEEEVGAKSLPVIEITCPDCGAEYVYTTDELRKAAM